MPDYRMGAAETKFADIIWSNEPIMSGELAKLAEKQMNWKKTTSFTVLKRLCERGLFQNEKGEVKSLVSKADFYGKQSCQYVQDTFGGSLPAFLVAFSSQKKLTENEVEEMKRLIDQMRG